MTRAWRPAALAAFVLGCGSAGFVAAPLIADAHGVKVIKITARRFTFVPDQVTLKKGETVTLEFHTEDVLMGFNAPDFAQRTDIPPGRIVRVTLTPGKAGTFAFLCDVFCGSGHENMNGTIKVVD